jgi:hypothetical protein
MKQPYPKVGQVWKLLSDYGFKYIFITQVEVIYKLSGATVWYEKVGYSEENKKSSCYATWLMVNAELVSG